MNSCTEVVMVFRGLLKVVFVLFLASVLFSGVCFAQTLGSIAGTVTDEDGITLPGVTVTISGKNLMQERYVLTNENGRYRIPAIPAGVYRVTAELMSFTTMIKENIQIIGGETREEDFIMMISDVERVNVVEKIEMVKGDTSGGQTFGAEMLQSLPTIGSDYQDIAKLSPGVRENADGEIIINGSRPTSTKVTVDGINTTDRFIGESWFSIDTEMLEQVEVQSSGFDAEFGGVQGGEIKMITKSGSNVPEAVVSLGYQSSIFDGNGAFSYAASQGEFDIYSPRVSIGGAFIKDKLWYYFAVSYLDAGYPRVKLTEDGAAHAFKYSYDGLNTGLAKLTYQLNPKNQLIFEYMGQYISYEGFANLNDSAWVPAESDAEQDQGYNSFSIELDSTLNNYMHLESQLSVFNSFITRRAVDEDAGLWTDYFYDYIEGSYPWVFEYKSDSISWKENLIYFKDEWFGNHEFKIGFELARAKDDSVWALTPSWEFPFREYPKLGYSYETYSQPSRTEIDEVSIWAQDRWRLPIENLTLQLGFHFRLERIHDLGITGVDVINPTDGSLVQGNYSWCFDAETLTSNDEISFWDAYCRPIDNATYSVWGIENTIPGILAVHTDNETFSYGKGHVSPRVGLLWDIYGDSKTIINLNAARNYDRLSFTASWETPIYQREGFLYDSNGDGEVNEFDNVYYGTFSYSLLDRELETPYTDEWGGGIERELTEDLAFTGRYVNRKGYKQLQDFEINKMYNPDGTIPAAYNHPVYGWVDRSRKNKNANNIYYLTNGDIYSYEAVQLSLHKRFARNWEMIANYTYSKSKGTGQSWAGTEGDDVRTAASQYGYLDDDQRHVANLITTNHFPAGIRVGTVISWESGLPYSDQMSKVTSFNNLPLRISYYMGSRNDQRSPSHWNVDMNVQKDFSFGEKTLTLGLKVRNLFNEPWIYDEYHQFADYQMFTPKGGGIFLNAEYWDYAPVFGRQWEFDVKFQF